LSISRETAFAKINLALHVREKHPDGYHRIETIFAFCEDGDELTAEKADAVSVEIKGSFASSIDAGANLVSRAADAFRRANKTDLGALLGLRKLLPVASGLGGGSADAAATLRLLNQVWGLNRPPEHLQSVGRQLGADVAACIRSQTVRGDGRGDELSPVDESLSGTPVLLVNPRVALSTAEVFARWDGRDRGKLIGWRNGRNDLQRAAASLAPQIDGILAWLSVQEGADCVRMSGSGATCFALFETEAKRDSAAMAVPREWWRLATRLR
jgi:4-diphosphocytidyl-2-C-methyl-D-erythritol kinase